MKAYSKKTIILFGITVVVVGIFVALKQVSAQDGGLTEDQSRWRCWLKQQCEDYKGIWGKGSDFQTLYKNTPNDTDGNGRDDWSENNCKPVGSSETARCFAGDTDITLQVAIPGFGDRVTGGFPQYLAAFYKFFVAALAVIAVVMVMWGGFKRIMAVGNPTKITDANDTIISAISGLVIALLSYSLLSLVNPRLVQNSLPPIEKVKPQSFGDCPIISKNPYAYQNGYFVLTGTCAGGTAPGTSCNQDSDCSGGGVCGDSGGTILTNPPSGDTCGIRYRVEDRECMGIECFSQGQGCFSIPGTEPAKYACSNTFVKGSLTGIEVNYIDILPVCNNGDIYNSSVTREGCKVETPGSSYPSDNVGVEGAGAYALDDCWSTPTAPPSNYAPIRPASAGCGTSGFKGYALVIEVEGEGADDWYTVDARYCQDAYSKRVVSTSGNGQKDDPKAITADRLDFVGVPSAALINPTFDASGGIVGTVMCNLNITRQEFRDR